MRASFKKYHLKSITICAILVEICFMILCKVEHMYNKHNMLCICLADKQMTNHSFLNRWVLYSACRGRTQSEPQPTAISWSLTRLTWTMCSFTTQKVSPLCLFTFVISESAARRLTSHRRSPTSFRYAISLNADWAGPTGKRTIWKFENLNGRLGPALDPPWTPSRVRLPVEPALFSFSKTAHGKELKC